MKLLRGSRHLAELQAGAAVTIGNFDGVHCGHQMLLAELKSRAAALNLPTLVVFFEPQPSEYFCGQAAPARLLTRREKLSRLADCGIDYAYCLAFNEKLACMSPEFFAECFIFSLFKAKYLLIGEDFRFGRDRIGTPAMLNAWSSSWACAVETYPDFLNTGERVSSTQLRHCLRQGDLHRVAVLLGRPYSITGRVVHGDKRGRQWGIPTANVAVATRRLPLAGVFLVRVKCMNQTMHWGVANLGCRPTVDGHTFVLEVHLFDFDASLYHQRIEVFFLQRLREEIKFPSLDALIQQIRADLVAARKLISSKLSHSFPFYHLI